MALLPVSEARARMLAGAKPLGVEEAALDAARGRVLAQPVHARRTQPPFAVSAMDGYALRAADTQDSSRALAVVGSIAAGSVFDGAVGPGQAARIFTGAQVPEGANTILIQEDATVAGDGTIRANAPVAPGRHIRAAGLDFEQGDALLDAGRTLDAGALSLAAAGNHAKVRVWRRPIVGILATGDELVKPGTPTGPGQIVAANSAGVAAIAADAGGSTLDLGIAGDTAAALNDRLDAAIDARSDVLIVLGGASVGDHDIVRPVFEARGMALDFWRIAMRPGKPMMFGQLGPMCILGLPGNPVSSLVCAHIFGAPLIAALAGRPCQVRTTGAKLAGPLPANGPREHYMRATLTRNDDGDLIATAFENQDSSLLSVFAQAHGLIVRAPDAHELDIGAHVDVVVLRDP